MFVLLEKWLASQLGNNVGSDLNLSNIGEKFKDGVMFARLLQKYQVIPDHYVRLLKRTDFYAACFVNIKVLNRWLKPLDISVNDRVVRDIACGQPIAVTRLLYQLYFKLETEKGYGLYADVSENERLQDGVDIDLCSDVLPDRKDRGKRDGNRAFDSGIDGTTFDIHKIWCDSDAAGVRYTAVDFLKSENRHKSVLQFIQHNMDTFYECFVNSLTDSKRFFRNEFADEETDKTRCERILDDVLGTNVPCTVSNNDGDSNLVSVLSSKTNDNNTVTIDNEHRRNSSNVNSVLDDSQHSISTFRNLTTSEYFALDEREQNERFARQNQLFDEYLEHTGPWSSERLMVTNVHGERKENIRVLSTVVKEVLNFEYGKSEIKPIALKKTQIAGVIDKTQNKKVVRLIADSLRNRGILSFTADDALSACLNAFNEQSNESKLYPGLDGSDQNVVEKQTQQDDNSDTFKSEFEEMMEKDSRNSVSFMTENASAINESEPEETLKLTKYASRQTQTYEAVLEPEPEDLNESDVVDLSPMAQLGQLIDEKRRKNHDLQIGDVINCVGEYLKENVGDDYNGSGWVLLEFPCQPLQLTLLEYKLTGKIPSFGRELCETDTRTSRIVPEHDKEENGGGEEPVDTRFLSRCVKIVQHKDEIKSELWNDFFDFYKERHSVSVMSSNNVKKHPKRAADNLVGMVLNEENEHKSRKVFKHINTIGDDRGTTSQLVDSMDSDVVSKKLNSELSSITITADDRNRWTNVVYQQQQQQQQQVTLKQFKLVNAGWSLRKVVPAEFVYKAFYLRNTWETMENSYVSRIKELLDSKDAFFKAAKARDDSIVDAVERTKRSNNRHEINERDGDCVFSLQCDLWDSVDAEWKRTTQFVHSAIDEPRTAVEDNGVLIGIYHRLLEAELRRAMVTLNVLNGHYECNVDEMKFDDLHDMCAETVPDGTADAFLTFCSDATSALENRVRAFSSSCHETTIEPTDGVQAAWRTCVLAEMNRFADQTCRIEANARSDKKLLDGLIRVEDHLETVRAVYRFKTNDINNLCKLLERADDRRSVKVEQVSGRFYVNGNSVFETACDRTFRPLDNFGARQLRTLAGRLSADRPAYKTTIDDLRETVCGAYPENWPKSQRFRDGFARRILGEAVTITDWRDFVVQCMELPCPDVEQLLSYRKVFVENDVRGDETVMDDVFDATRLWFENGSAVEETAAKKRLLSDVYSVRNGVNYSAMLLAFCRDERPWMGLRKSFGLIFGRDPTDWKNALTTDNNDLTGLCQWYATGAGGEQFIFDEDVMTWFLKTCLNLYLDRDGRVGNVNISQIVKSVYANVQQTARTEPATIVDLFRNKVMDELYGTVYKFQTRKLSEIAKNLVMEYNVCVEL